MRNSAILPGNLTLATTLESDLERVCQEANQSQDRWIFRPADADTLNGAAASTTTTTTATSTGLDNVDTSLLFGITRRKSTNVDTASQEKCGQLCTFYLAYSTWEGRVLFWDALISNGDNESNKSTSMDGKHHDDTILWTRLLAKMANAMNCRRLVWRHREALPPSYGDENGLITAETLHGWLTIYWDLPSLRAYAPCKTTQQNKSMNTLPTQRAFAMALEQSHHDRFRLRLATDADIDIIDGLVMGLAIFEKEPESYILSKQQLRKDGFGSHPLYYCILVDDTTAATEPHTCAMAFCYLGHELSTGRFLYLEDLFFEEAYRGQGGGKLVMSTLALVAQSLGCTKAVWQALDWNTPAM